MPDDRAGSDPDDQPDSTPDDQPDSTPDDQPDSTPDDRTGPEGERGFSFSLPPISLPPLFPEDFRVLWPAGGRPRTRVSARTAAVALVAFDLLDAALALAVDSVAVTAARTVGGALVAGSAFGLFGLPYLLEVAAGLAGHGRLTAFPTLAALLVVRRLR